MSSKKKDSEHVIMSHIPHNSIQNYKTRGNCQARLNRYGFLLQVIIRDKATIFDLHYIGGNGNLYVAQRQAKSGIPEINYLENIDQLTNPQRFVNTGFMLATSNESKSSSLEFTKRTIINTNELSTLCFAQE